MKEGVGGRGGESGKRWSDGCFGAELWGVMSVGAVAEGGGEGKRKEGGKE